MIQIAYPSITEYGSLNLIQNVSTRWNSTYEMLKRALKFKEAVDMFILGDASFLTLKLTVNEWQLLDLVLNILKPLQEATLYLSSSKYPTILSSMRTNDGILQQIEKVLELSCFVIYSNNFQSIV